jgi:excisionase family DNA binding protein
MRNTTDEHKQLRSCASVTPGTLCNSGSRKANPIVAIGFMIFCFGLLLFLGSAIFVTQGSRDPAVLGALLLGLVLVLYGNRIYKRRMRKLINKRQVAELFGVSESTIERWMEDGKLPRPKTRLGSPKWDYGDLAGRRKFKSEYYKAPRG